MKYRFVRYRFIRYWFRFLSRPWINTDILVNIFFISKTSLRHMVRRLEDVLKTSWKTKICYAEDALKTSSRHVFKTSWRPANVCWVLCHRPAMSFNTKNKEATLIGNSHQKCKMERPRTLPKGTRSIHFLISMYPFFTYFWHLKITNWAFREFPGLLHLHYYDKVQRFYF